MRINRETLTQLLRLMTELAAEIEAAPPRLDGSAGAARRRRDGGGRRRCGAREAAPRGARQLGHGTRPAGDGEAEEGARLAALLRSQLQDLTALVAAAEGCAAAQPAAIREKLLKMLASLTDLVSGIPEERVAQEMAMLVTRSDVREELERLRAHLDQAGDLLGQGRPSAAGWISLCQELNREANTLCAKSADIDLTRIGLSLKAGVEQFREQVQNIE